MLKRLASVALLASIGILPVTAQADEDRSLAAAIQGEFINQRGVPATIRVEAAGGVATLTGIVYNEADKLRAEEVAAHVAGVSAVMNEIRVDHIERQDDHIRNDIERALASDETVESWEVNVGVTDGVVSLTGQVDSEIEKMVAERTASAVAGVSRVGSEIVVLPVGARSDKELLEDVRAKMAWDPALDEELLHVSVHDGRAFITGHVGSAQEKARAVAGANVEGMRKVDSSALRVSAFADDNAGAIASVQPVGSASATAAPGE
mgnify:CR=1 FL=1